ncbi:amino acid ABC transporter permease [Agrilactobacillus yilanensis]|uniref:Amino acid ABC transporter permease n=1 Tax=Agrilactobacillus yilanensis TaxID=2485997 RepID=A0ABW4J7W9_9LACO|nr:amino acid ABC transporter permease [Agrilactobacillus yilanensis]
MAFDWSYFFKAFPQLFSYIPSTLFMAFLAMALAVILGIIVALLQASSITFVRNIAKIYVSIFRGIPTLVQLFIVYYGLPQIFPVFKGVPALMTAICGLGIKQSAYLAEIFRAAINSVDQGQIEAGLALNIKYPKLLIHVVMPQAVINAIPATSNTFISLLKETSLAFTLGITELFAQGKMLAGASFKYFETYVAVGLVYWLLIVVITWGQHLIEKSLNKPYRRFVHVPNSSTRFIRNPGKQANLETH